MRILIPMFTVPCSAKNCRARVGEPCMAVRGGRRQALDQVHPVRARHARAAAMAALPTNEFMQRLLAVKLEKGPSLTPPTKRT